MHRGEIPPDVALDRLNRIWALPIRLLGDAVLRRRAWDLAELARRLEGIVPTATIEALGPES